VGKKIKEIHHEPRGEKWVQLATTRGGRKRKLWKGKRHQTLSQNEEEKERGIRGTARNLPVYSKKTVSENQREDAIKMWGIEEGLETTGIGVVVEADDMRKKGKVSKIL